MNLYDDAIVAVALVSPPLSHAYLRMAGTRGAAIIAYCIQHGGVPVYVDILSDEHGEENGVGNIPVGDSPSIELLPTTPTHHTPPPKIVIHQPLYTRHGRHLKDASLQRKYSLLINPTTDIKAAVALASNLSPPTVALWASVTSLPSSAIPYVYPAPPHATRRPITEFLILPTSDITQTALHKFLNGFECLETIGLFNLDTITHLEGGFLQNCSSLTGINLSPLSNVTSICSSFMAGCSGLKSINLSPLDKVSVIGGHFLHSCSNLQTLRLPPCFHRVTYIGNSFAVGCTKLESIDLSGLSSVTVIGSEFLADCVSLSSIDLGPLSRVSSVGDSYLKGCRGLAALNLQPLNLVSIPDYFLLECKGLKTLDLSPLSKVISIGSGFLASCSGLRELDLAPLAGLKALDGGYFLQGCTGIASVDLKVMANILLEDWDFKCVQFPLFDVDQSVSIYVKPE